MSTAPTGLPSETTQAEAVEALASLTTFAAGQVSAAVLVEQPSRKPAEISQLRPTPDVVTVLSDLVQSTAATYSGCELVDYQPAGLAADGQVMWIDVNAVPLLKQIRDDAADLASLPLFEPAKSRLRNLRLVALRLESDKESALVVQSLRGSQVLARSTRFGFLVRRGVLELPQGEVISLTPGVVTVLVGDFAFFKDRPAFQKLFDLLQEVRDQAKATLREVTQNLRIDNFEQMLAAVSGQPAMLGKMASIKSKVEQYPQYKASLTMPKLAKFVRAHPECGVDVAGTGDQARLVYRNDPQHRFKILKLLDDDYLRSQLTTLEYEANSKSAPLGAG